MKILFKFEELKFSSAFGCFHDFQKIKNKRVVTYYSSFKNLQIYEIIKHFMNKC